jgi:hypothetical protein
MVAGQRGQCRLQNLRAAAMQRATQAWHGWRSQAGMHLLLGS